MQTLIPSEVPAYIRAAHNIPITYGNIVALIQAGRGPRWTAQHYQPRFETDEIDRWASQLLAGRENETADEDIVNMNGPTWLIVSENAFDGHILKRQFEAFDCGTMGPCYRAGDALIRSSEMMPGCDAAFLEMDWNIEAVLLIADNLTSRGVPFIVGTRLTELPTRVTFAASAVLRMPYSIDDISNAIRDHFPDKISGRMKLDNLNRFEQGEEGWIKPPANPAFYRCYYGQHNFCSCEPHLPACDPHIRPALAKFW